MKIKVRSGIFETNSSSVHTLVFKKKMKLDKCEIPVSKTGKMRIKLRYFGKNEEVIYDQEDKLAYLITLCIHSRYDDGRESFKDTVEYLKDSYGWEELFDSIKSHVPELKEIVPLYSEGWGIDHQASCQYESIYEFLGSLTPAEFVFCNNLGLHTTCD